MTQVTVILRQETRQVIRNIPHFIIMCPVFRTANNLSTVTEATCKMTLPFRLFRISSATGKLGMHRNVQSDCKFQLLLLPLSSQTGQNCGKLVKSVNLLLSQVLRTYMKLLDISELFNSKNLTLISHTGYLLSSND
jgi:hypothetical protein